MSSLHEIQTATEGLPPTRGRRSRTGLPDADGQAWDRQITEDFTSNGAGKQRLADIDEQIRLGQSVLRLEFR